MSFERFNTNTNQQSTPSQTPSSVSIEHNDILLLERAHYFLHTADQFMEETIQTNCLSGFNAMMSIFSIKQCIADVHEVMKVLKRQLETVVSNQNTDDQLSKSDNNEVEEENLVYTRPMHTYFPDTPDTVSPPNSLRSSNESVTTDTHSETTSINSDTEEETQSLTQSDTEDETTSNSSDTLSTTSSSDLDDNTPDTDEDELTSVSSLTQSDTESDTENSDQSSNEGYEFNQSDDEDMGLTRLFETQATPLQRNSLFVQSANQRRLQLSRSSDSSNSNTSSPLYSPIASPTTPRLP